MKYPVNSNMELESRWSGPKVGAHSASYIQTFISIRIVEPK